MATPTSAMDGHNRALAVAEAARVLAAIPVPPGATESKSAPARRLGHLGVYNAPLDPSLTRTNWWVVPMSYRDLVNWYRSHSPANRGSAYGPDGATPSPHGDMDWAIPGHSASYSTPAAVVSYARLGPATTAIRTDATLAARYDRTSATLVPSNVTRIDITKTILGNPALHARTTTATDPALLTRVTAAFNTLGGAAAHTAPMACGSPAGTEYVYAVTFHWPGHTLAVDPGAPLCGVGMGLTLDGNKLPQTLAEGSTLDAALQATLDAS